MAGGGTPIGPSASPLGQAWGYGIVLGVGFLFALGMVCAPLSRAQIELKADIKHSRSSLLGFSNATTMKCRLRRCSPPLDVL